MATSCIIQLKDGLEVDSRFREDSEIYYFDGIVIVKDENLNAFGYLIYCDTIWFDERLLPEALRDVIEKVSIRTVEVNLLRCGRYSYQGATATVDENTDYCPATTTIAVQGPKFKDALYLHDKIRSRGILPDKEEQAYEEIIKFLKCLFQKVRGLRT